MVVVHGGGWASSTSKQFEVHQALSLQAAGLTVVVANYDTYSKTAGAFPVEVDDVVAATRWAQSQAAGWGADPGNVELLGGSAGGQLVELAADQMNAAAPQSVRAVVTLSGALDLVVLMQDVAAHSVSGYLGRHLRLALACGSKADPCTVAAEAAWSPAEQVASTTCPMDTLVVNDTDELMPVDQATSMMAALAEAGCPASEILQPGRNHSFAGWPAVASRVTAFLVAN